jgi:hypothetical protein
MEPERKRKGTGQKIRGAPRLLPFPTGKEIHLTPINKSVARRPTPRYFTTAKKVSALVGPSSFNSNKTKGVFLVRDFSFDGENEQKRHTIKFESACPTPSNVSERRGRLYAIES